MGEMVEAFDVADVNPNPARFDIKKATAINATHIRRLDPEDFVHRLVPVLYDADLLSAESFEELTPREQRVLVLASPLVQTRIQVLAEAAPMLAFLFTADHEIEPEEAALKQLREGAKEALAESVVVLGEIDAAQCELMRVEGEMEELFGEMGTVGKDRVFQLLEAK